MELKMNNFPSIKADQVALLQSDSKTGIVLNKAGTWASNGEDVFLILESFDLALKISTEIQLKNKSIEVCIYDCENKLLRFIPAPS